MAECVGCTGQGAPGGGRDFCGPCWDHIEAEKTCPNCGVGLRFVPAGIGGVYVQVEHPQPRFAWVRPLCSGLPRAHLEALALATVGDDGGVEGR